MVQLLLIVLWHLVVKFLEMIMCNFQYAFAAKNHVCSVLESKLWSICDGLKIAKSRGYRKIHVFAFLVECYHALKGWLCCYS